MLYLGNALLRYVLIYNLAVSFNFHLTFQQLNVIEMFTICSKNCFFFLTPGYFLRAPEYSSRFQFPLKVRVIGTVCTLRHITLFCKITASAPLTTRKIIF